METVPYDITYSPDDADQSGKGWYAQTFHIDGTPKDESDLFETEQEAVAWVRDNGGNLNITPKHD